jgi:hypothetical protein
MRERATNEQAPLLKSSKLWQTAMYLSFGIILIVFLVVIFFMRGSIRDLSKDSSVISLTTNATQTIAMIINKNKNTFADSRDTCWNQKNPYQPCSEENKIDAGAYAIRGTREAAWLEGPLTTAMQNDDFMLSEDQIRNSLKGFAKTDTRYNQAVYISYMNEKLMQIDIETMNNEGDRDRQTIYLSR